MGDRKRADYLSANNNVWMSAREIVIGITKAPTGNYRRVTRIWDLTISLFDQMQGKGVLTNWC